MSPSRRRNGWSTISRRRARGQDAAVSVHARLPYAVPVAADQERAGCGTAWTCPRPGVQRRARPGAGQATRSETLVTRPTTRARGRTPPLRVCPQIASAPVSCRTLLLDWTHVRNGWCGRGRVRHARPADRGRGCPAGRRPPGRVAGRPGGRHRRTAHPGTAPGGGETRDDPRVRRRQWPPSGRSRHHRGDAHRRAAAGTRAGTVHGQDRPAAGHHLPGHRTSPRGRADQLPARRGDHPRERQTARRPAGRGRTAAAAGRGGRFARDGPRRRGPHGRTPRTRTPRSRRPGHPGNVDTSTSHRPWTAGGPSTGTCPPRSDSGCRRPWRTSPPQPTPPTPAPPASAAPTRSRRSPMPPSTARPPASPRSPSPPTPTTSTASAPPGTTTACPSA